MSVVIVVVIAETYFCQC